MRWYELPSIPENFASVLREHEGRFSDRSEGFGLSPLRRSWEHQLLRALRFGIEKKWEPEQLNHHLEAAHEVLSGLSYSLNSGLDSEAREEAEKKGVLYRDFELDYFRTKGLQRCPIDKSALDDDLEKYLATPALSCGAFDWLFVNAYLRYYIEDLYENVASGAAFGTINWSYLFSGGKPAAMLVLRLLGAFLGFVLNWLLLPSAAAYAYIKGHAGWALGIAALFAATVLFRIIAVPAAIGQRKDRRKLARAFEDMMTLKYYAGAPLWNPTDLLLRVRQFESTYPEVYLMPLTSLLARAVDRDPHVLARELDEGPIDHAR